mgnify:CR=1 FL=1
MWIRVSAYVRFKWRVSPLIDKGRKSWENYIMFFCGTSTHTHTHNKISLKNSIIVVLGGCGDVNINILNKIIWIINCAWRQKRSWDSRQLPVQLVRALAPQCFPFVPRFPVEFWYLILDSLSSCTEKDLVRLIKEDNTVRIYKTRRVSPQLRI